MKKTWIADDEEKAKAIKLILKMLVSIT